MHKAAAPSARPLFTTHDLIVLTIPLLIEQFLVVFIGMADTVMVTSLGEHAVSAVSLVDNVNVLINNVFSALATGGAVIAAQYLGRREQSNACSAAKQLLIASLLIATALGVVCLIFNGHILRGIFGQIEDVVMRDAMTYFMMSAISYPFIALYSAGAAMYRSMGNSRITMYVSLLMNVMNVAGNALTIYVFGWGVGGAGFSSLLSRIAGSAVFLYMLRKPSDKIFIHDMFKWEWHGGMVKRILRIGVPTGLENSIFQVGKLLVLGLVSALGTAAIAANAISNTVSSFTTLPGAAISLALVTVVGQCMGAGETGQAELNAKKLTAASFAMMAVVSAAVFFLAEPLAGMFNLSEGAIDIAAAILRSMLLYNILFWSPSFALPNALRAAGDVRFTMLVSVISMWLCRVALSYLFVGPMGMGVLGVWYAMYADWVVRALIFTWRFLRGGWKKLRVI